MDAIFSTDTIHPRDQFRTWRDMCMSQLGSANITRSENGVFHASLERAQVGSLALVRLNFDAHNIEAWPTSHRHSKDADKLRVVFKDAGVSGVGQFDRASLFGPGDMMLFDHNAASAVGATTSGAVTRIDIDRDRIESKLGSARLYSALSVGADLAANLLARSFFTELARVHKTLSPDMAEKMAGVGIDLIIAALAERMALEIPRTLTNTVLLQRAKAFIENNLSDPTFDPPQLAIAMRVSLRRLQSLFHAHGRQISDWIWQRRLDVARERLADPGFAHLSIGVLAYGCGFVSQAHFSRRFRARFDSTPSDYRQFCLMRNSRL